MKKRYKILVGFGLTLVIAVGVLGRLMSYNAPCEPAPPTVDKADTMQALRARCYGGPELLTIESVPKPEPAENQVLVRIRAASVNPLDWHVMRGEPYFMRLGNGFGAPTDPAMGVDFAGTVEAVGAKVTRFKVGDRVFGGRSGALAQFAVVRETGSITHLPDSLTFEQGASVAVAAVTALQALREHGQVQPGQQVLVNGASGGVGTFAVQIAKALGAEVTAVCSTRNLELVRSLGADHVIDYTRENVTAGDRQFDLIVDNVSTHSLSAYRRVLRENGRLVIVGGTSREPWIGAAWPWVKSVIAGPFMSQELIRMIATIRQPDMEALADLMRAGKVTPVIDRSYPLDRAAAAIAYLESGRARGKVVITMPEADASSRAAVSQELSSAR